MSSHSMNQHVGSEAACQVGGSAVPAPTGMGDPVELAPGQSTYGPTLSDVGIVPAPSAKRIIPAMGKASGWERDISPVLQADTRTKDEERIAVSTASAKTIPHQDPEGDEEFFSDGEGRVPTDWDPKDPRGETSRKGERGTREDMGKERDELAGDIGMEGDVQGQRIVEERNEAVGPNTGEGIGWNAPSLPSSSVERESRDSALMEGITLYGKSDDGGDESDVEREWPRRMLSRGEIMQCMEPFSHNELLGLNRPAAGVAGGCPTGSSSGAKRSRALMSEGRDLLQGKRKKAAESGRSPIMPDSDGSQRPAERERVPGAVPSLRGDRAVTLSSDEDFPGGKGLSTTSKTAAATKGKPGRKKRAKKGQGYAEAEEDDEMDDPLPMARSGLVTEETERSSVPDIYAQGVEHLSAIEEARRKSKNLQGGQSKTIKNGVTALRELLVALSERAQSREEIPAWMAKENQDLRAELLARDKKVEKLQMEVETLRDDVRGLMKELKKKAWRDEKEKDKTMDREVERKKEEEKKREEERRKREEREKAEEAERRRDEERIRLNEEKRKSEERKVKEKEKKERKEKERMEQEWVRKDIAEKVRRLTAGPLASAPGGSYARVVGSGAPPTSVQGGVESLDHMIAELVQRRRELEGLRVSEERAREGATVRPARPGPKVVSTAILKKRVAVVDQRATGGATAPVKGTDGAGAMEVSMSALSSQEEDSGHLHRAKRMKRQGQELTEREETETEAEWEEAKGARKKKKRKKKKAEKTPGDGARPVGGPPPPGRQAGVSAPGPAVPSAGKSAGAGKQAGAGAPLPAPPGRRVPRTAAVTITGVAEGFSYGEAMKRARESIPLEELGLEGQTRVRKAQNGGMLIEVQGVDGKAKADALARKLAALLGAEAKVARPCRRGEIRVVGFDDSVSSSDVRAALAEAAGCTPEEVSVGEVRLMANGLCMAWGALPIAAAIKGAAVGRIRLGWSVARVELLKARPLQCYRCWKVGHVSSTCRAESSRAGRCFRCGEAGHLARACNAQPKCLVCGDAGLASGHRMGGPQCRGGVKAGGGPVLAKTHDV